MFAIKIKRIYEKPIKKEDGYRILVDRLWPRGMKKEAVHIDLWIKEIAPSNELRQWYHHETVKWSEFKKRYLSELAKKQDLIEQIYKIAKKRNVTLLYSAKDEAHNNAVVLREYLAK